MSEAWRLLPVSIHDGAANLAIDEAIARLLAGGGGPPTLRFYGWSPPCLSIGRLQQARVEVDLSRCHDQGIACVRRPTGGRAVLHDRELTYSVVAPLTHPFVRGSVRESYRAISGALASGLARLGVPLDRPGRAARGEPARQRGHTPVCFGAISDYELSAGGRKLVGSAQVRADGVLLQHGSILLQVEPGWLGELLRLPPGVDTATLGARMVSLAELLGRVVPAEEAAVAVAAGFADALGVPLTLGRLTPAEEDLARRLAVTKYRSETWNLRY